MRIVGLSVASIPWPIGERKGNRTLVIIKDLVKALRNESNQAVAYWWGVTPQTVTKWRKALGIGRARMVKKLSRIVKAGLA